MNDELRVVVVASWCFTRLQLLDGRFKLFYCKVGPQVGIGSGCSRKQSDLIFNSRAVQRVKSLSASAKRPSFRSCEAMEFAITYGAPFSHLFTELKISPIEVHISAI